MEAEGSIKQELSFTALRPSEKIGQHFLVDKEAINLLVNLTDSNAHVLEIGSGVGHITEILSKRARFITGIEIDKRFQPMLEKIQGRNKNISFIMKDATKVDFKSIVNGNEEFQIIANLPFHITEPFMYKLIDLPFKNAILLLGDSIVREFQEDEDSLSFGKMSLLSQTFFETRIIKKVPKTSFYPQPRTDAYILELVPKNKVEIEANKQSFIFAELFRKANKHGLVINDIKQSLVDFDNYNNQRTLSKKEFHQRNRAKIKKEMRRLVQDYNLNGSFNVEKNTEKEGLVLSQSKALEVINKMQIPESILLKPFSRLDNQDIRDLTKRVRAFFSNKK